MASRARIKVWKKREGRWLSFEEYLRLYPPRLHKPTLTDVLAQEWRSHHPVMDRACAALQTRYAQMIPPWPATWNTVPNAAALLLDAGDEKAAFIFPAPKAGEVAKPVFRTGTVTTGATMDCRLETVDATTGDPTGTLVDTNSNVSVVIADADDNRTFVPTLTATATVTADLNVAVVVVNPAVSPGNLNVSIYSDENSVYPYHDLFAAAAWTKAIQAPISGLEYDDGSYEVIEGVYPFGTTAAAGALFTTLTFNSGSTPDEIGLIFQLPYPFSVSGYWAWLDLDGDADIVLYDSDGTTARLTSSLDTNIRATTGAGILRRRFSSRFACLANTNYRLVVKPTSVTNLSMYEFDVPSAAAMDGHHGGQNFHKTSRTDAGAWTQVTTKRPFMGVLIDQFDDGVQTQGGNWILGQSGVVR